MNADLSIELPYIKLPYDVSVKNFKQCRKMIEKEMDSVLHNLFQMKNNKTIKKQEASEKIKVLIRRLNQLKRKLNDEYTEQEQVYESCKKRILHLNDISKKGPKDMDEYHLLRLRRQIIDYLVRDGNYKSAEKMMEVYGLKDHCQQDLLVIKEMNEIIEDLKNHSISKAMQWCKINKSKLQKVESNFEFKLFQQQFIEYIKDDSKQINEIIQYLQQNSLQYKEKHSKEIEKLSILVLFKNNKWASYDRYKDYFLEERWENLINQFRIEIYKVFSVTTQSLLNLSLNVGLSCLKTLSCDNPKYQKKDKCPVCQDTMLSLSSGLPSTQRFASSLICRISGEVMDQHNLPAILPNGQVYSYKALEQKQYSKDQIQYVDCPITQIQYEFQSIKKIYLA